MTAAERTRRIDAARERGRKHSGSVLSSVGSGVEEYLPGAHIASKLAKGELPPVSSALPWEAIKELAPGPAELAGEAGSAIAKQIPGVKQAEEAEKSVEGAAKSLSDAVGSVSGGVAFLTNTKNWARLGKILGGAIVILIGLYMLLRSSGAKSPAVIVKGARTLRG